MNKVKIKNHNLVTVFVLFLIVIFMSLFAHNFLSPANFTNILRQVSLTVIVACGTTFIMIAGGLDISVGGVLAVTGVVAAKSASMGFSVPISFAFGILFGLIVGLVNAFLIEGTKIPTVIATLGTMYICRGLAYVISGGNPIIDVPDNYSFISATHFGPIPLLIIIMLVVFIICHIIFKYTLLGKYTLAIGGNTETSKLSGIKTVKIKTILYAMGGTLAGIGGVLMSSRLKSGDPNVGMGFEFDCIVAVVIGGTSLIGGEGSLSGTFIGALIVAVIANGMNLMGIGTFYQYIIQGGVLVLAVIFDQTLKGEGLKFNFITRLFSYDKRTSC
ncbi:MAG TPA: ABC transporter permease [Ruminiclostridium sp.]